jgi:hypothetical protein
MAKMLENPVKMVRCFYLDGRGKVLLQSEENRRGKKGGGIYANFIACEAYIPETHVQFLKADRRYGIKYLTLDDFYKLAEEDPLAADKFHERMTDWCRARKKSPPVIRRRYVEPKQA